MWEGYKWGEPEEVLMVGLTRLTHPVDVDQPLSPATPVLSQWARR